MAQDTKERGGKAVSSVLRALLAKSNWFHIMVLLSEQDSRLQKMRSFISYIFTKTDVLTLMCDKVSISR